jgi:RimJ/RimL family protein N-acetyltransferase
MTDLLGVMESWTDVATTVRDESGALTEIALADIVTGKPVPPRPSVRLRVPPVEAQHRAAGCWPAPVTEPLGRWLLRAAGGFSRRANSALAAGDPGLDFTEAVDGVERFYAGRGLPARAQVVVGSAEATRFERAGWAPEPDDPDTVFLVAPVSRLARTLRGSAVERPETSVHATVDRAWLADDRRALAHGTDAVAVLEGPAEVAFVSVGDPVLAKGRVALCGGAGDPWAGITDLWVGPARRRQGLALTVLAALTAWAAERGATTAFAQCVADNAAAAALYDGLGFVPHHRYRYVVPGRHGQGR